MATNVHILISLLLAIFSFKELAILAAGAAAPLLSNETDREALLAFKSQIKNDPRKAALDSWNDSLHFCDWRGIICGRRHHQRVVGMNLSVLHLSGRISPHIGNLSFLKSLSLPNNSFHGEIPHELGRLPRLRSVNFNYNLLEGSLPATLSNCSRLRYIYLRHNRLAGRVPPELGFLLELRELSLRENSFAGVFPLFITNLSSLTFFSLSTNYFHGSIPEEVGKLSRLHVLGLADNSFTADVPPTIYNLTVVESLTLDQNQLSGNLSPDIGYFFPKLVILQVYSNHLTGKIPVSLCNSSSLRALALSNNRFVGPIPTNLGKLRHLLALSLWGNQLGTGKAEDMLLLTSLTNCSELELLDLSFNRLGGSLPACVANFSEHLRHFSISDNLIHGPIPATLGNVFSLQILSVRLNSLTGPIPLELGKLQNLGALGLGHNRFSGQIPESFGNLSRLSRLDLADNHLQGRIPSSIRYCSRLQELYLENNHLSGTITDPLFGITSLIFLDLSRNSFDGNLPAEVGQFQNLNYFNASHNKLSGGIPTLLGNCKSLVSLDLSFNSFEGIIPMALEALSAAEIVDLSSNHLNGSIPSYFTKFGAIQVLNLSFNALGGEVPLKGPFTNASKIYLLGNSELCGGIIELHLPPCPKLNVERDHHHKNMRPFLLKIIIPCSIGILIVFVATCYLSMSYWRKRSKNALPTVLSSSMKKQYMQITYAELHRATNGFSVANLIGSGSFGSVFKGVSDSYGQMDIAVKVINIVENASGLQGFISECEALKKIRHRNVVRILTSCSSLDFQGNEFRALVFKFMKNGSLDSWLHPNFGLDLYLSFRGRLDVAIDVANALDYLHNQCETPIIHCDLKPSNILLDEDMVAQVSDFGLAKVILSSHQDNSSSYTSMLKGSIGYIPPEYGERYRVTPKGDVYSYGVLLLEMFMGKRPNHEMFKDGLSISKHAEIEHRERLLEIVDPRMMQNENFTNHPLFQTSFSSIIEVAISCTSNLPQMRKNVSVVCSELHAARAAYQQLAIHKPKNILLEPAAPSTGFFCNNKNNKTIV